MKNNTGLVVFYIVFFFACGKPAAAEERIRTEYSYRLFGRRFGSG